MTAISQTTFSSAFFVNKTSEFRLISLKFVLMGPINNTSTMVQEMSWRRTQFSGSYMGAPVRSWVIGIDTKIGVIVVSPTTWEAHHSPRAKPEGCGELSRSFVTPQWPKSRYQFLFYQDVSKHTTAMQIRVCISRKLPIKLLPISHNGKHGHRQLTQQLPQLRLGYYCDVTVMPVSLNLDNMPHWKTSKSNKMFL